MDRGDCSDYSQVLCDHRVAGTTEQVGLGSEPQTRALGLFSHL